jgi:hypothetical protein
MNIGHLLSTVLGSAGQWRFVRAVVLMFAIAAVARLLPLPRRRADQPRRRARTGLTLPATVTAAVMLAVGGCAYTFSRTHNPMKTAQAMMGQAAPPTLASEANARAAAAGADIGVFEPSDTASYRMVDEFMKATGTRPGFVLYYSGWNDPFQIRFAGWAHAAGAIPFAQMEPAGIRLADITAGRYDGYLHSFASAVRGYLHRVILGFAPEMNGNWYTWGAGHTAPADWVAAWRHVVDVFRQAGASNVTWLWTVNSINAASAPLRQWWPGASYVTWVGIDGYYYQPAATFASVFGTTISEVRTFTRAPILISETAAGPSPEQASQIAGLFRGIHAHHLRGAIWFDMPQDAGAYHQDWRIEDSPAALAAFSEAAKRWPA